jgi:hypothetical protein
MALIGEEAKKINEEIRKRETQRVIKSLIREKIMPRRRAKKFLTMKNSENW